MLRQRQRSRIKGYARKIFFVPQATIAMQRQHGLPEEDGVFDDRCAPPGSGHAGAPPLTVAVIAWSCLSNLDEFQPLKNVPDLRLI